MLIDENDPKMKLLQKENLRLLESFVQICEKNNIWYCLAYGTMLGAVRHSGMIPWDRDVDVYIKVSDISRIRKVLDEELPEHCSYKKRGITKRYSASHELLESNLVIGAHLDIYPLVGAPTDVNLQAKFTKQTTILRKLLKSKYVDLKQCLPQNRPMVSIAKIIDIFISDKNIERIYKYFEKKYDYNSSEYVVSIANYGKANDCIKKELLFDYIKVDFEHMKCNIPRDYDTYLTQIYGDYMTPKKY